MKTYEECKKIAIESVKWIEGAELDTAGELPDAYIFDDSKNFYDGGIPIVIRKSDGKPINKFQYMVQNDLYADDIKEIPF